MNWSTAKDLIWNTLRENMFINNKGSKYKRIKKMGVNFIRVIVGSDKNSTIRIDEEMLEKCFYALISSSGYEPKVFKELYPESKTCYRHSVGMIFVKSGFAKTDGKRYWLKLKSE